MGDAIGSASSVRLRVGLDIPLQRRAGEVLVQLSQAANRDFELLRHTDGAYFHPKLYVTKHLNQVAGVIGSSNASTAAFGRNVEANLIVTGPRGSPEEAYLDGLIHEIDAAVNERLASRVIQRWRLPGDALPDFLSVGGRAAPTRAPEAPPPVAPGDAWQLTPEFLNAEFVAEFESPISGVLTYVTNSSRQGGFDIKDTQMAAVERIIPRDDPPVLQLCWRFLAPDGTTLWAIDEEPRVVRQSGYGGHNRVITARLDLVARPLVARLRELGISNGDAHLLYKLERRVPGPFRLWMVHTLPVPGYPPEEVD